MRTRPAPYRLAWLILGAAIPISPGGCTASAPKTAVSMPSDSYGVRPAELALRQFIEDAQTEHPTYAGVEPQFAHKIRSMARAHELVVALGPVRSIAYKARPAKGRPGETYEVVTANAVTEWMIALASDGRIKAMIFRPVEKPSVVPSTEQEFVTVARARLEKGAADDTFAGAVIVAKGGKPIFQGAYGQADRERAIPNQPDTKYRIGSMTKMFTAVAVLQLVEAGKLGLDDPVGKHLLGYPNAEIAKKVTIGHLLTHTGGTGTSLDLVTRRAGSGCDVWKTTSSCTGRAGQSTNRAAAGNTAAMASSCWD